MAPLDRGAQGALSLGSVPCAAGQERQPLLEALQDLCRGERLDPCGGELEREWEVVEAAADLGHCLVRDEVGLDRPCPGAEELDALFVDEREHRVFLLPADVERLATRHQHTEVRAGAENSCDIGRCFDDVLEVVEQQEQLLVGDVRGEAVPGPERLCRRLEHDLRVAQGSEWDPEDAVRVGVAGRGSGL